MPESNGPASGFRSAMVFLRASRFQQAPRYQQLMFSDLCRFPPAACGRGLAAGAGGGKDLSCDDLRGGRVAPQSGGAIRIRTRSPKRLPIRYTADRPSRIHTAYATRRPSSGGPQAATGQRKPSKWSGSSANQGHGARVDSERGYTANLRPSAYRAVQADHCQKDAPPVGHTAHSTCCTLDVSLTPQEGHGGNQAKDFQAEDFTYRSLALRRLLVDIQQPLQRHDACSRACFGLSGRLRLRRKASSETRRCRAARRDQCSPSMPCC
jgi:hypothetical protein